MQKSDGGYLYATTDLAALHHRVHQEGADRVIYVTDAGQAQHFNMVFKAAELAGILTLTNKTQGRDRDRDSGDIEGNDTNDTIGITIQKQKKEVQLTHVPFGLVLGEDGKKIKSRSGDSVKLRELLDEAVRLAAQNEAARIAATGAALAAGVETPTLGQAGDVVNIINALDGNRTLDLQQRARIIGLGAVKYADLSMHRESSYKFSFNKMLSLSGNTAPYMLYAYVRIRGIQRRAAESLLSVQSAPTALPAQSSQMNALLQLEKPAEAALGKQLVRFHEVLLEVADSLCPNKVIHLKTWISLLHIIIMLLTLLLYNR